ncbi:intermembrane lipid transfer protein VPS13B [Bacillus rossius redtenbacheri]|uniref:intermembrane lipid transfer protein VPS13B n=1 Tax=Bacillus rossius redtenbacheri TaxID=93214 RepID=UPI002FDE2621
MFKIESYITPILLSYVDKYIKDFRAEDSQVSLWGGDASFHNLDLRLEVLERELPPPFRLASGHVHQLLIHVPWTKLASEPISITINTIECKLELRGADAGGSESAGGSGPGKDARRRTRRQDVEAPPGYIQSLINRIVNNITIICNNVILKYEEEDIVLSVNAKTVTLQSASSSWEPAFVEMASPHGRLRKLVSLSDLTVCLDKRNSSGKIEVYQEPLLYRCSMEVHLLRDHRPSLLRADVRCAQVDLRLTEQQVPMFLRLLQLCLTLYRKELRPEPRETPPGEPPPDDTGESSDYGEESWVGWAWNLLPAMPLAWDDDDDGGQPEGQPPSFRGHTLHLGLYVDNASVAFKVTESSAEKSFYGSRKVRFVPFLQLDLQGCYLSCVAHGAVWLNTRLGASGVRLRPAGQCFCGQDEADDAVYLVSGKEQTAFLQDSLFHPGSQETPGYSISWNQHVETNTEAVLLEKSPACAVDYIYMLEVPDDLASEQISELGSDLEYSDLPEKSLCRLVVGPTSLDVCSGLLHRAHMVRHAAGFYDYAPYSEPGPEPARDELPPVTEEDFEALDQYVPQQVAQITLIKPVVRAFLPAHPPFDPRSFHAFKKRRKGRPSQPQGGFLPSVVAECSCLDARITRPMYPRRLVTVTCQLPSPPHHMFSLCYRAASLQLMDVRCRVVVGPARQTTVLTCSRASCSEETLLLPQYWTDVDTPHRKLFLLAESLTTTFTKPKLLVACEILRCLRDGDGSKSGLRCTTLLSDAARETGFEYLEVTAKDAQYRRVATPCTAAHSARLGALTVFVLEPPGERCDGGRAETLQAMVVSGPGGGAPGDCPLASLTLQHPLDPARQLHALLLLFTVQQVDVCVDPLLWRWLQYRPREVEGEDSLSGPRPPAPPAPPPPRARRKLSSDTGSGSAGRHRAAPRESVHSSSDREVPAPARPASIAEDASVSAQQPPAAEQWWGREALLRWFPAWRGLVMQGRAGHVTLYLPASSLSAVGSRSVGEAVRGGPGHDALVLRLPAVAVHSAACKQGLPAGTDHLPVRLPPSVWAPGSTSFPWSVSLAELGCHTVHRGVAADLVRPFSATSTVIVTTRPRADEGALAALGVCVHVDIKPVQLSVSCSQMRLVVEVCTGGLAQATHVLVAHEAADPAPPPSPSPSPAAYKASGDSDASPASSVSSARALPATRDGQPDPVKVTLWMQATLARVTVSLGATGPARDALRVTLDMEDIMTSLDLQRVYLKVISKVSSASVQHFVRHVPRPLTYYCILSSLIRGSEPSCVCVGRKREGGPWQPGQFLGLVMKAQEEGGGAPGSLRDADDTAGGFLRVTFTRVRCRDAHSRWGARKPSILLTTAASPATAAEAAVAGSSSCISEVVVKLQAVDCVLSAAALAGFQPVLEPLLSSRDPAPPGEPVRSTDSLLQLLNSSTLPLLYLDTHAVRLVMPAVDLASDPHAHDVCVFQVDAFNLKPKADNPVGRLVVRPDVYQQAERTRLLGVPGSEVEDRQYQLDVRGLAVHTGTWRELARVLGRPASTASALHTMSENPALEWNNLAPSDEDILPHATLLPVVSRLNVCAVLAPAVFYRDTLVCGASLEAGATSPVHASVSLGQLRLAAALLAETLQLLGGHSARARASEPRRADEPEDSGVDCADASSAGASRSRLSYSSLQVAIRRPPPRPRPRPGPVVPVEALLTAGTVVLALCEEAAGDMLPLLRVAVAEPHVFASRLQLSRKLQVSCFDLAVSCPAEERAVRGVPGPEHFPAPVLETKAGDPHPGTGIPPSFLTAVWSEGLGRPAGLDLELGRPTRLHASARLLSGLGRTAAKLLAACPPEVPDDEEPPLARLRRFLSHTPGARLRSGQLAVAFQTSQGWVATLSVLGSSVSVHAPGDRLSAVCSVSCLTVSTCHGGESRLLVNPCTFDATASVCWEAWDKQLTLPQVQVSVDSDCLLVDVGPEQVRCLRHLWRELGEWTQLLGRPGAPARASEGPDPGPREDQHYHDDLRAGAFRYCDAEGSARDRPPLPYQVVFWADPPTMAWRYPQPRALTRVDVFPVPFQLASDEQPGADQVLCSLEHWSECRASYQPYATFSLSESEMCRLELPRPPRVVASCAWRVRLSVRPRDGGHLSPRALAACMLVDSSYCPALLPRVQLAASVSCLRLSLHNQLREDDVPPALEGYAVDGLVPESQCFLTLAADSCHAFLGGRLAQVGARVSCSVTDYACLGRRHIVEPFGLRAELVSGDAAQVSCVAEPVALRLGPGLARTLAVSAESWAQAGPVVLTGYVVCNDTARPVRFGQAGTDEDVLLMSRHCHMYAWRSLGAEPLLRVGIEEGLWVWCTPFPVHADGVRWCPLSDCGRKELNIVVRVVSLSATQKMVVISGQLVVTNKLVQHLECQVVRLLDDNTRSASDVQNFIVAGNSTVPSILVDCGSKMVLRIRFHGQDSAWSGDIPLCRNTKHFKPWLVKVPLQDRGQFLCVWCRVIVQRTGASHARMLVILCPLYMICSWLASPASVTVDTPGLQVRLESAVSGRGEVQQLYCPGTIDHTHSLTFQLRGDVPSSSPVPLSYTMVDQREFFTRDLSRDVDIDHVLDSLTTAKQPSWPYLGKKYEGVEWIPADQPETDVRVKYEPLNEFCSTLLVTLQPWALIANLLGVEVSLVVGGKAVCQLPHNGVVSPPKLPGTFYLEAAQGDVLYRSQALQLARPEHNTSFYMPRITGLIPSQGNTQVCMQGRSSLMFVTIESDLVKEMHTISVQPRYILVNCSSSALEVVALAVAVGGGKKHVFAGGPSVSLPACGKEGLPLMHFSKLGDGDECLAPYLAFSQGAGFSCPVQVSTARARQNFTVPCTGAMVNNAAYVLTAQERDGQVFVAVHAESHPPVVLHNKCRFSLLCAQVSADKDGQIVEESAEFDWWCIVEALSSAHYSMPLLCECFPSLGKGGAASHIAFAICSGENPEWSLGFCVLDSWEQFIHIPRHGDVKVKVERFCHTSHVTVETVSHVEISARDIRSRLSNKDVHGSSSKLVSIASCENSVDDNRLVKSTDQTQLTNQMKVGLSTAQTSLHQLVNTRFEIFLQGLCVKMLDDLPKSNLDRTEVINLSLDGVCLEVEACLLSQRRKEIDISLMVGDVQLDNQMFHNGGFDFPVIFTSQMKKNISSSFTLYTPAIKMLEQIRSQALLKVAVFLEQSWTEDEVVVSGVKNLNISIGPLCAYIEDTFVVRIFDYLSNFLPHKLVYIPKHVLESRRASSTTAIPEEVACDLSQLASPLRMDHFVVRPASLVLSVHTSVKLYIAIDHSPLHFASFEQRRVATTPYRLGHALTTHYVYGAIFGAGWVVGSLELIGSPGGLARTVGSGLRDFVYLPYRGMLQGPRGFLAGVTHGSASLVKHVTAGTLSSVTKLAASFARNVDRLSLDGEHLQRTEELRRRRPQGVADGLAQGLTGLGISLLGAIGGIAHHPLQSMLSEGASPRGLAAGVGRGLVGAVTKPLSGAAELLALAGQGLLHGAGWASLPRARHAPARELARDDPNSLLKYSWKLVAGRHALLHVADATLRTPAGHRPVALVLTTQALFVVDVEEDVCQRVLSLSELAVAERSPDPTLLCFRFRMPAMPMDMDPASHARVVDYVRHSAAAACPDDSPSEAGTSQSDGSCEQGQFDAPLTFLVAPLWRDHFVSVLELAKRHSEGRGFAVL